MTDRVFARMPSGNFVSVGDVIAVVGSDDGVNVEMVGGSVIRAGDDVTPRKVLNLMRKAVVAAAGVSS